MKSLVVAAKNGDQEAFAELIRADAKSRINEFDAGDTVTLRISWFIDKADEDNLYLSQVYDYFDSAATTYGLVRIDN